MAVSERTSVFEMRRRVRQHHRPKLTPAKLDQYPFRDIDRLRAALASSETHIEAAEALGCASEDIVRWASIYSLEADALLAGGENDV